MPPSRKRLANQPVVEIATGIGQRLSKPAALLRLKANAYGMTVRREIEERTGRNISIGAVYATLERLERKGYISSFVGEPTAERGGRAKRLFRIEADGEQALRASQDAIRNMTLGLRRRWGTT